MTSPDVTPARPVILLVEDDATIRGTVCELLEGLGYDVLTAPGPREALVHLRADCAIAVLFSDVLMNDQMDGIGLAFAARRLRPTIRVLLCSGMPLTEAQAAQIDGAEFIAKPFRLADLMASLDRLG